MLMEFFLVMFLVVFMMFLLLFNFVMSKKMFKSREKMSSFECGFDVMSSNRLPFSLQFFLITVIFLIFDIEIALILPMIYMSEILYYFMVFNLLMILFMLILGLYLEWLEGALKWFK